MRLLGKLTALLALSVLWAGAASGQASAAEVKALSQTDASLYVEAFQAAAQGSFEAAERALEKTSDKSLAGYIELQRLMAPETTATYEELTDWLSKYSDLPGADKVLALARKRRPRGAPEPRFIALYDPADADAEPRSSGKGQAAREAYYSGDVDKAYRLAVQSGERWIAGLAAFRLKNYADAMSRFQAVAMDPDENEWLRAGAAYWAARSAIASGQPELAPDYLRIASRSPATFYGLLAERQLGLEPGADPAAYVLAQTGFAPAPPPADGELVKAAYTALSGPALDKFAKSDVRARRAAALAQIGRPTEAVLELKAGLAGARSDVQRRLWAALALDLNGAEIARAQARRARGFDPDDYPTPPLDPKGGFTLDRALVYAVVRQESRFDPYVVSYAGAVGLMQLMPHAAARAAGDDKLLTDNTPLYDASFNLRVGQDYLDYLGTTFAGGDVLRTIAAYNGGPGALQKAQQATGDGDALLVIESMPAAQTRDYVERVMAAYWIYRRVFGESSRSIDLVASGANHINMSADR